MSHLYLIFDLLVSLNSPCFCEIGPVPHHPPTELNFLRLKLLGRIEWLSEDVANFVAVHHARPAGPGVAEGPVLEVVHVDVVACLGVPVSKFVDVTRELVVADHLVQRVTVLDGVLGVQPVRVLEYDGLARDVVDVGVQLAHRLQK